MRKNYICNIICSRMENTILVIYLMRERVTFAQAFILHEGTLLHGDSFSRGLLFHEGTLLHGVTFAHRVTLARVDNFARRLFCTSVTLARGHTFAQRQFCTRVSVYKIKINCNRNKKKDNQIDQ